MTLANKNVDWDLNTTAAEKQKLIMFQKYQLATELAPVTLVGTTPFAIVVPASIPVKTIAEWDAYAKANNLAARP